MSTPTTKDWTLIWGTSQEALSTKTGYTFNIQDFQIFAEDYENYSAYGRMSSKKQSKGTSTIYWWGYATQINFKKPLEPG